MNLRLQGSFYSKNHFPYNQHIVNLVMDRKVWRGPPPKFFTTQVYISSQQIY